jgi:hypothetical protein
MRTNGTMCQAHKTSQEEGVQAQSTASRLNKAAEFLSKRCKKNQHIKIA